MNIKHTLSLFLLVSALLAGCATLEAGIETATTDQLATATVALIDAAETPSDGASPTTDAATATPTPESEPQPTPSSPYAGLVYRLADELFRLDSDGQPVPLAPGVDPQILPGQFTPRAAVSHDGKQMLSWWDWSDLWLVDLVTGQTRNLTNTPGSDECCAQFWPARPDVVVFLTRSTASDGLSYNLGAVNLDGTNYHILDEANPLFGLPALSPDGNTLAYDAPSGPLLYRWDVGSEAFNPQGYNQPLSELTGPAWTPSGRSLSWMTGGSVPGSLTIFDLQTGNHLAIHPHQPFAGEGGLLPPVWSPDGSWVAIFDHSLETPGVWVARPDGSGEMRAYQAGAVRSVLGLQAFWSPDAQRLLVADPNAEGGTRLALLNVLSGQSEASPLPEGAIPLAWVR